MTCCCILVFLAVTLFTSIPLVSQACNPMIRMGQTRFLEFGFTIIPEKREMSCSTLSKCRSCCYHRTLLEKRYRDGITTYVYNSARPSRHYRRNVISTHTFCENNIIEYYYYYHIIWYQSSVKNITSGSDINFFFPSPSLQPIVRWTFPVSLRTRFSLRMRLRRNYKTVRHRHHCRASPIDGPCARSVCIHRPLL